MDMIPDDDIIDVDTIMDGQLVDVDMVLDEEVDVATLYNI